MSLVPGKKLIKNLENKSEDMNNYYKSIKLIIVVLSCPIQILSK